MAVYNEILVGRFNRFIQKFTQIKGGPPAAPLSGEIIPVLPLENFDVSSRFLASWERFGGNGVQGAVVAATSNLRLRNPAGSNVIAVVEKITFILSTAASPQVLQDTTGVDLATIFTVRRLDARGRSGSNLIFSGGTGLFGGVALWRGTKPTAANDFGDVILTDNQELPLLPGDAYNFANDVVNAGIQVSLYWRERFLEESERT